MTDTGFVGAGSWASGADGGSGIAAWSSSGGAPEISASHDSKNLISSNVGVKTAQALCSVRATNFGFSVPGTATIRGVEMYFWRDGNNVSDTTIKLIVGGSATGSNQSAGAAWPTNTGANTSQQSATFGGAAVLWGTTLTPAQVNASNFGAFIQPSQSGPSSPTFDACFMRVTYALILPSPPVFYKPLRSFRKAA